MESISGTISSTSQQSYKRIVLQYFAIEILNILVLKDNMNTPIPVLYDISRQLICLVFKNLGSFAF